MDWVFVGEKEFDDINCAIQDVQICLKCGSENILIRNDQVKCKSCQNIISICEDKNFV